MEKEQVWKSVLGELEISLSKANFTTWFKNTQIVSLEGDKVIVGVPNVFTKEWLEKKYHPQILEALGHAMPSIKNVEYRVGSLKSLERETQEKEVIKKVEEEVHETEEMEVVKASTGDLNPKYILETFVVGNSNKLAFAACQSVAENPPQSTTLSLYMVVLVLEKLI